MQRATPLDLHFYFPGYADGGISGDLTGTALAVALYQRMPQLPTINTTSQKIPRLHMPEAIAGETVEGYAAQRCPNNHSDHHCKEQKDEPWQQTWGMLEFMSCRFA